MREQFADEFDYLFRYTEVYRSEPDKYLREAKILKLQTPHILQKPAKDSLICGEIRHSFVNFSVQYGGKYMYNFEEDKALAALEAAKPSLSGEKLAKTEEVFAYWREEKTLKKLNDRFAAEHADTDPRRLFLGHLGGEGGFEGHKGVISVPDARLALTIPDIDKLLRLGVQGLREELHTLNMENTFIQALDIALETITDAVDVYADDTREQLADDPENELLRNRLVMLEQIRLGRPESFYGAVQLYWIYAVISDLMNHGRMDVYLGDFYAEDRKKGVLDEEKAVTVLTDLWRRYDFIHKIHDTRVVIGGLGRRNPENADALAMIIMETSRRFRGVVPQLTLRTYTGMDNRIFEKALQVNAEGCSFPILYSDDTNVPAVMKSFEVPEEDAQHYIPAGCGEYVMESLSVGTPNSAVNLAKVIELLFHNGKDACFHVQTIDDPGDLDQYHSFEEFFAAYRKVVEQALPMVAWAEKANYDLIAENCGCLHLSLLMHDCLEKQKPLLEGGVRYVTGATEVNGLITAADSLSSIRYLVFDRKVMTLQQMKTALDADFEGYEMERRMMQNAPKYGNDDDEADEMALRVFNHIADSCRAMGSVVGLDKYLACCVNNSESAVWGEFTMATPCGRKNGEALANAHGPSLGADKSGSTALLNSMCKFDHCRHAGVINNIRFSKELFRDNFTKMEQLIWTYLTNNGNQLNLMVIGRDDLINAKKHPEQYRDLIIRIGGFSARFVELSPLVQEELIRRTTFEG